MAKFSDVEKVIEALEDLKNHEAHYAEINRYISMINALEALKDVSEKMAEDLAANTGKSKEEIISEYYEKI